MKTMIITATLASVLFVPDWNLSPAEAAVPYQSDDYGFPVESYPSLQRRKPPGRSYWSNRSASCNLLQARECSRDIYRYSRDAQQIEPTVAKPESEELGRNIAKAQRELAAVSSDSPGNAETVAALKSIKEHLAKATEHQENNCTRNVATHPSRAK